MQRFQTYDSKQAKSNNDSLISHGRFARFEFGVSVIVIYLLFVIWIFYFAFLNRVCENIYIKN